MARASKAPANRLGALVFATRGFYLLAAQVLILWLKQRADAHTSVVTYAVLLAVTLLTQILRTWAAGLVGTVARRPITGAPDLLTAGPYAYVRNPMYLGNLVITTALALMSGLWYAPIIAWVAYAGVYAIVIPYEERYLEARFGQDYRSYKQAVPRLLPEMRRYARRNGTFRLGAAIANELAAWVGIGVFAYIYAVI